MKHQLTNWFPPEIKPVYKGVYEVEYEGIFTTLSGYSYWDGKKWGTTFKELSNADTYRFPSPLQYRKWRGIDVSGLQFPAFIIETGDFYK